MITRKSLLISGVLHFIGGAVNGGFLVGGLILLAEGYYVWSFLSLFIGIRIFWWRFIQNPNI